MIFPRQLLFFNKTDRCSGNYRKQTIIKSIPENNLVSIQVDQRKENADNYFNTLFRHTSYRLMCISIQVRILFFTRRLIILVLIYTILHASPLLLRNTRKSETHP